MHREVTSWAVARILPVLRSQVMHMGFGRNGFNGLPLFFLSYLAGIALLLQWSLVLVVTRHSSAGRDGCFNYPQRLMEPGRTLPALVSETGRVSTRFLCGSLVMWKFMYCGFVVKCNFGSLLVEVTQTGFYKSHMVKRKSVNQETVLMDCSCASPP